MKQFQVCKRAKFELKLTVHCGLWGGGKHPVKALQIPRIEFVLD